MADREALMKTFNRAFALADREALADVVTEDFEWHRHWYLPDDPVPTGNVTTGVDAVDLRRIADDRLILKDTYWKRPAIAGEER